MSRLQMILLICGLLGMATISQSASAQITREQRKELGGLSREISRAGTLIRKKELDEAKKILDDVEAKVRELAASAKISPADPALRPITASLARQIKAYVKAGGMSSEDDEAVSFMKDVAPIIVSRCVQCHGPTNPRNGLRLDRFAGWRAGGKSGPVLIPQNSFQSLIIARVNAAEGKGRMPPNGDALTAEQKEVVSNWINQGAKFDGASEDKLLADLIYEEDAKNVKIPQPKGGETVSFSRDIAPWFTNLCLNCHNARRRSGGLSLESFFDLMKGGDSGEVILPGDMENSRLFRLVGGKELPRMPQGQARITRKNYEDLVQWFKEGNTYDGSDPRAKIASLGPSDMQMAQQGLATLSDADLQKLRQERSEEQYRKAISSDPHPTLMDEHFLLLGNVDEKRLAQVKDWAEEALKTLQKTFDNDSRPWRGRLAIFVLKDGFSYNEFNEVIERQRTTSGVTGHSKITPGQEDAYVVLQETAGSSDKHDPLQVALIDHLTGAYLQKSGKPLPEWLVRGAGLAMADLMLPDRQRSDALEKEAFPSVASLSRPEELFNEGALSPAAAAPVGYTLVKFLMASGGPAKFSSFIKALNGGATVSAALQSTYGTSAATIASGYVRKLKSR